MTTTRRIAQLVKDLRELNVIKQEDKIKYSCDSVEHHITIKAAYIGDFSSMSDRCASIYQAFLEEFSPEQIIKQNHDYSEIEFILSKNTRKY